MPDEIKLINTIDAFEANSLGGDRDGELSHQRAKAIDAYLGRNLVPNEEGRSQVVDWTVFETIQWILPSLTRIFANGDNIVEFAPQGPEDEDLAEQESDYLNYLVTQKNNWFMTILTWFQDALLTKNGYCLATIEEVVKTEKHSYEGQSEEALALLLEDEGTEVIDGNSYPDPNDEGQLVEDPVSGEVVQLPPRMLYDVTIRNVQPKKKLCFKVLPPENCKVDDKTPDFTTENCDYFEYFEDTTLSDIRARGYDVPDDIMDDGDIDTIEDDARDQFEESYGDYVRGGEGPDPSTRKVRARHIWVRFDYDEDGIAELQYVFRIGNTILEREEVSRIPVASIVPFINTHRHMGTSVADATYDLQQIKTALLRGGLDSLYLSSRPRHVVSEFVHLEDLLVSRPGAPVRMKPGTNSLPGEGHVLPLTTEFTLPQTLEGLRHMDTVVESRVGVNRIFQGIDEGQLNDHNRIGQLSTMAAQRVEQIARIFANGVEYLFSLAHELIIKSGHQSEVVKLRGNWVTIDPSQWRTGRDMRVVAPFAAGNKDTLVARLLTIAQLQEKALAGGLPIVDAKDAYNTAIELTKASDFPAPEKFWTDPATVPPPEPQPDYTLMALEIENKKADNAAQDSTLDAEVKSTEIATRAEVEKYVADLRAQVDIALEQLKAGHAVDLKGVEYTLANAPIELETQAIRDTGEQVREMKETMSQALSDVQGLISELEGFRESEREIERDEFGSITGIKVNGKTRKLKRDKNGRITGI